jgi:DNA excision repair protein ERCC-2
LAYVMQLSCHDASLAFSQILGITKSFMITSSTLCVPGYYPQILRFEPITQVPRVLLPRDKQKNFPLKVMTITHGNDQSLMRLEPSVIKDNIGVRRNIMNVITELVRIVPDGMVVIFPSMSAIQNIVAKWTTTNQHEELLKHKLIFIETYSVMQSSFALDGYYRACDNGRGGLLFCVAGGRIARAIDLRSHYGRAVVILGYPMDEVNIPAIGLRAKYMDSKFQFPTDKFIKWNSLRSALSCLSTILSSKSDYGVILLVDRRYDEAEIKDEMLPLWIRGFLTQATMGQGVEEAKEQTRKFLTKAHIFQLTDDFRVKH